MKPCRPPRSHTLATARVLACARVGAACLAGTLRAWADTPAGAPHVELSAALLPKVAAHVPAERPLRPLARHSAAQDFDFKSGAKVQITAERELALLASGLVGIVEKAALGSTSTQGQGVSRSLSLCGLVTLLAEGRIQTETATSAVLPAGPLFVPFGFQTSAQANDRTRLTALTSTAPRLCSPRPGTSFTYTTAAEVVMKTAGLFTSTQTLIQTVAAKCQVARAPEPASKIHPDLQGDQLPVACDVENADGSTTRNEYAYLVDSAFYLLLRSVNPMGSVDIRYPAMGYTTP